MPLGSEHNGPDVAENVIVLCPNHHVMCDYGAFELKSSELRMVNGHNVSEQYIEYHNSVIYGSRR
jgi:predicted restriction endonuclease